MKNVFKNGNGYQAGTKKLAKEIGAVLVKLGKIPTYNNDLPVDCFVTTDKNSKLMVVDANHKGELRGKDCQGLVFTYDGDRLLVVGIPSHKQLQEHAVNNKRAYVTWSEVLGFSQRGHFTVV